MYRRILVPLDGTRFGDHALPYAVSVASRTGAMIELVHVHHHRELDPDLAAMPQYRIQKLEDADADHDAEALSDERSYVEERAADIELRYGVRTTARILAGPTAEAIWREANSIVADLVIMATHARQGLPRLRLGDLAHELVQHLNVPALCVRPPATDAPLIAPALRRALVTLDGSDFSEQILDVAAPLFTQLGMSITLLHVVSAGSMMMTGMNDLPRLLPHRQEALAYLQYVAHRLRDRMPAPELIAIEDAEPAHAIASIAAHGDFDVIAAATHGRNGLSRLLLGSVADQLVRTTSRPVLLYRPRSARLPLGDLEEAFRISS